jgi:hypothetical protein
MPTPEYQILRASITDDDCLHAFDFLHPLHIGYANRASIEQIAFALYGSANDSNIRKTRDVVELLRLDYGIAVCSSSGKAGRWLASSENEKRECLADFYARRNSIDNVIRALERAQVPPPAEVKRPQPQAIQAGLF